MAKGLTQLGLKIENKQHFDTIHINVESAEIQSQIKDAALSKEINFRYLDATNICISLNESTTLDDVEEILSIFKSVKGFESVNGLQSETDFNLEESLIRISN